MAEPSVRKRESTYIYIQGSRVVTRQSSRALATANDNEDGGRGPAVAGSQNVGLNGGEWMCKANEFIVERKFSRSHTEIG